MGRIAMSIDILRGSEHPLLIGGSKKYGIRVVLDLNQASDNPLERRAIVEDMLNQLRQKTVEVVVTGEGHEEGQESISVALVFDYLSERRAKGLLGHKVTGLVAELEAQQKEESAAAWNRGLASACFGQGS